ncbi:flagellar basal body rod protein FlgF [Pandoraea terrae]|uniref:Flagellar basal-body rod protein FlgF n=1 Tax=Pandoraea terrae TaxID=1537710 RepID=A0A5E4W7D6_9BURK|nr:flagellar basal body rod protein FlgF [Pandoraea terrae]VVE19486.1 flagellar basal body rod protein FlgF [Pandoraea terrae]
MDRLIYVAMSGAKQVMEQQSTTSNNLANAATPGFRAQLSAFRQVPVRGGDGADTRTFVTDSTPGSDFTPGAMSQTGRALDVAIEGQGWLAVRDAAGREAYTRGGNIQMTADGQLTLHGRPLMSDAGQAAVPPGAAVSIGSDGTLSALGQGDPPNSIAVMGQLKLVNPPEATLVRGDDGLFRTASGQPAPADPAVVVVSGAIEQSNVNPVSNLVNMISQSRAFEMHMKLLQTADNNEQTANQLLNFS